MTREANLVLETDKQISTFIFVCGEVRVKGTFFLYEAKAVKEEVTGAGRNDFPDEEKILLRTTYKCKSPFESLK